MTSDFATGKVFLIEQRTRTMTDFSFKDAPDLMDRLRDAQNRPENGAIDIMTIAAFMRSREELEAHVVRYEKAAA